MSLDTKLTREVFDINFFGSLEGVEKLFKIVKRKTQFIAISSSSALKGSGVEGVGYPASKAALSIAFESLYQKYKSLYDFKTIYFGPVASGMTPFKRKMPFLLSEEQAVKIIIRGLGERKPIIAEPKILFFTLKLVKLLPTKIYFAFLSFLERFHRSKC